MSEKNYEIIEPENIEYGLISVKRLNDGVIYMVGDETKDGMIVDFEEKDNTIYCMMRNNADKLVPIAIDNMEPIYLFITDDGVAITNSEDYVCFVKADHFDNKVEIKQLYDKASVAKATIDNCECITVVANKENLKFVEYVF